MRRMGRLAAALLTTALAGAAACSQLKTAQPTAPGDGSEVVSGSWTSATSHGALSPGQCGSATGQITSRTSNSATGTVTARCYGDVSLNGTVQGTATGTTVRFTSTGTATGPDGSTCSYSLAGSAVPESSERVRVTYSGSSCFGPLNGSGPIKKS